MGAATGRSIRTLVAQPTGELTGSELELGHHQRVDIDAMREDNARAHGGSKAARHVAERLDGHRMQDVFGSNEQQLGAQSSCQGAKHEICAYSRGSNTDERAARLSEGVLSF